MVKQLYQSSTEGKIRAKFSDNLSNFKAQLDDRLSQSKRNRNYRNHTESNGVFSNIQTPDQTFSHERLTTGDAVSAYGAKS